ncbi:Hint domain-containing protein [Celeribacter sp. ULVN23_4]
MGYNTYNISEVTGATGSGSSNVDIWTFDVNLDEGDVTTVSGDFDVVPIGSTSSSEASSGYSFTVTSGSQYGELVYDSTTGEFTFIIDRSAVYESGSDQTVVISVTGTDSSGSDTDTVNINLMICVARGTLVETESGPVPVEKLAIGDMVKTVDAPARPVRWIGCSHISNSRLKGDPSLRPIRISAGTFGDNRPSRDLMVSPQHRILVKDWRAELLFGAEEVLVPAKGLVNDQTIRVDHDAEDIDYFHVLFDQHEIMVTEGLETESFHPGDYSLREIDSEVRDELFKLFPALFESTSAIDTARMALRPWESILLHKALPHPKDRTDDREVA